ncbi:hypothetical protein LRB11_05785 [Ectothiorhodospira haloalkaliphila]|uniref:hypothetical protein n=1 Tax=Ectothiorhodospira haloalkaliphila TaxID=421628 RepID=UPI001EE83525|nr:hypothetical protein [Ectothiorhodospira haloalkaliphila]MCG5524440.1 hypothetical protein [Ectothiorhodospira haloalkaliphila]
MCQAIIALMPPHDTYIETHLGGGAIMQRMYTPTQTRGYLPRTWERPFSGFQTFSAS